MKYDLENRTKKFSKDIIKLLLRVKKMKLNENIISQLIRSATSVGANYCEANGVSSRKDFKNKIYICKKEAKETKYWLQLIAKANPDLKEECRNLWKKVHELTMIFSRIILTMEKK